MQMLQTTALDPESLGRGTTAKAPLAARTAHREVVCLLGLPIDVVDLKAAVSRVTHAIRMRERCLVSTPNVNFLVAAQKSAEFRRSVQRSQLVLADGSPVIWLSKLMGAPLPERVSGADLFEALRHGQPASAKVPVKVFFFGGPPGAAESASEQLGTGAREDASVGVGFDEAGFGSISDMSSPEQIDKINASAADFLVVSLGAAKGQSWILNNLERVTTPVISHLGAVVNFVSGRVTRAPVWVRRLHLEWLFRIWQEPALWRRYAGDAITALLMFASHVAPFIVWNRVLWLARDLRGVKTDRLGAVWELTGAHPRLVLSGALSRGNLAPLRVALEQMPHDHRVEVDCSALVSLDLYGLGLLASAFDTHDEQAFTFSGLHWSLAKLLRFAGAGYLLERG
ncbi:MAG TPA: WecB/TagA/CpsF family glycosyltransferase [Burkholderiaceae bacterium]